VRPERTTALEAPRPTAAAKSRAPRRGRPTGKFTQQRRLDRLRTALEQHPAGLSIAEIATVLHVTTRSVRRYLGYLKATTPIEAVATSPGRENVWRIKPSERARSVALRRAPAYCLLAGRSVFEPMKGSALFDALDVVHREALQVASRPARGPAQGEIRGDARLEERLLYLAYPPLSHGTRAEQIDDLFRALADLHVLHFRYGDVPAARGERVVVHPYAVLVHRGALRVVAHDVYQKELRLFAFERMADLIVEPEDRFALPPELKASDFAHGAFGISVGTTRTRLLVEFDARAADDVRARKLHPTQKIATSPDGRIRLSVQLPPDLLGEARRWVLGYGDAARVIEPLELAAEVARALAAAARRYT
jgi:predicted DNA-binding transcriptional regulator YafY